MRKACRRLLNEKAVTSSSTAISSAISGSMRQLPQKDVLWIPDGRQSRASVDGQRFKDDQARGRHVGDTANTQGERYHDEEHDIVGQHGGGYHPQQVAAPEPVDQRRIAPYLTWVCDAEQDQDSQHRIRKKVSARRLRMSALKGLMIVIQQKVSGRRTLKASKQYCQCLFRPRPLHAPLQCRPGQKTC